MFHVKLGGCRKRALLVFTGGVFSDWALHSGKGLFICSFVVTGKQPLPRCLSEAENQAVSFRISSANPLQVKAGTGCDLNCSHTAVLHQLGPCCAIMLQIEAFLSLLLIESSLFISFLFAVIDLFLCI